MTSAIPQRAGTKRRLAREERESAQRRRIYADTPATGETRQIARSRRRAAAKLAAREAKVVARRQSRTEKRNRKSAKAAA